MNLKAVLAAAFLVWVVYTTLGTVMYTARLASFYEVDWSLETHGIAINGKTGFGDMISVAHDLSASIPSASGGTVNEICPGISSERGHLTVSTIDDNVVCCHISENQWLVPFKEADGKRHYLCGAWPFEEHVTQNLENVALKFTSR